MNKTLIKALRRLGYRPIGHTQMIWAKPVGYQILVVNMNSAVPSIANRFYGSGTIRSLLTWNSGELGPDSDYEHQIKSFEYSTRLDVGQPYAQSDFGFLTQEETYAELL